MEALIAIAVACIAAAAAWAVRGRTNTQPAGSVADRPRGGRGEAAPFEECVEGIAGRLAGEGIVAQLGGKLVGEIGIVLVAVLDVDDLGFDAPADARTLRSMLEGGAEPRPANVRLLVTANRRHLQPRDIAEQDSAINPRDSADDHLALADRFGLSLGFHALDQDGYVAIVAAYVITRLATRLYERSIMRTGGRLSYREAFKLGA